MTFEIKSGLCRLRVLQGKPRVTRVTWVVRVVRVVKVAKVAGGGKCHKIGKGGRKW